MSIYKILLRFTIRLTPASSYRIWLKRMRKERPARLTITSLELPDAGVPLIDFQLTSAYQRAVVSESTTRTTTTTAAIKGESNSIGESIAISGAETAEEGVAGNRQNLCREFSINWRHQRPQLVAGSGPARNTKYYSQSNNNNNNNNNAPSTVSVECTRNHVEGQSSLLIIYENRIAKKIVILFYFQEPRTMHCFAHPVNFCCIRSGAL